MFFSPIKGITAVDIDYDLAAKAVLPNKQPGSSYGINLQVKSFFPYTSKEYWNDCWTQLKASFDLYMKNPIIQRGNSDFSVFSVAPIPLIIKLGELIGDKLSCDVYQKTRFPDTWEWQANELTNSFTIDVTKTDVINGTIALNISLTNDVNNDRIYSIGEYEAIYKIKANITGVDCIKSIEDLSAFWHTYQYVLDEILNKHGAECQIHLFPAMPVSAAFEVGRRYMLNTHPIITIFEENSGFFETLKMGGQTDDR